MTSIASSFHRSSDRPPGTCQIQKLEIEGRSGFDLHLNCRIDRHVSETILRYGCWEPIQTELMKALILPGDSFVDVGASIGWFTLLAGRLVGRGGQVFAFEPEPENVAWLRHNVRRNDLPHVRVENMAAAEVTGEGWLYRSPDPLGDHRIYKSDDAGLPLPIELIRLDNYFATLPSPLDVVKIDTRGAELRVLAGFRERLCEDRPAMLIELWNDGLERAGADAEEIFDFFGKLGGKQFILGDRGLEPTSQAELASWAAAAPAVDRHLNLLWMPVDKLSRLEPEPDLGDLPEVILEAAGMVS